jgi:sugar phosphate isomerase/epimerase
MHRFAMCNEAFGDAPIGDVCRTLRGLGYSGIEIAPYTLGPSPDRREIRAAIQDEGMEFVGLHWLMVSPPGLHLTTSDDALRRESWGHLRELIDLSHHLAHDLAVAPSVMVLGSPRQRGTTPGTSRAQATERLRDGLAELAPYAGDRHVTILLEALPPDQCDVVQTLAEAAAIVHEINSPAIQTMFDTHNAVCEIEPHDALIERFGDVIKHVHVNEMDGRHPGTGNYDFAAVLSALERIHYAGWISLEVFDFKPDPVTIARETIGRLL